MARFPIQLVIPMSGQSLRFKAAGYPLPKPLIPVNGHPMAERLLSLFPQHWECHFVLAENHRATGLVGLLEKLRPAATITFIPPHSKGPGQALMAALNNLSPEAPVFVSYCDYGMVWDCAQFERFVRSSACDACVVCYRGFHPHYLYGTKYAFCRMEGEKVVEVREKGSFTANPEQEFASAGGYYFKTAETLRQALERQFARNLHLNGEYYTSLTVEALLQSRQDAHVRVFEIPGFFQWGTPEDLQRYEYWEKTFDAYNASISKRGSVAQVLMPMAGIGSRFAMVTRRPKPLIPVRGVPMFVAALNSLPKARDTVVVGLRHMGEDILQAAPEVKVRTLNETPPGQALTTQEGLVMLNPSEKVIVSSCDHAVVLSGEMWDRFRRAPECDAAIFTVRGYDGCSRRPNAYAYVVPEQGEETFPLVSRVSVKKPVSDAPAKDALLVGTFWFQNSALLGQGITELKHRNVRVNGELCLDSIFTILLSLGYRVRMIELEGYIGWGDPDSLAEASYWHQQFCATLPEPRARHSLRGATPCPSSN